jgi:hypothetical protein
MKAILAQMVQLQAETTQTLQAMTDHLDALTKALYLQNPDLEAEVRREMRSLHRMTAASASKFQSGLGEIRKSISQLPE